MAEHEVVADLEKTVRAAARELGRLRERNRGLETRLRKLEAERRQAPDESAGEAWKRQRTELRERVEKLAGGLEELL